MMEFELKKNNGIKTIISYLVIFYLVAYAISYFIVMICGLINIDLNNIDNKYTVSSFINLLIYIFLLAALLFINHKELILDAKEFTKDKKNIILKVLAGYGIFYVVNVFCSILVSNIEVYANFAHNILGRHELITSTAQNQSDIELILNSNGFWMMFLSAGILGPICEEVVFRKAFFNICKTKEMGILLSSLCFGLIHITSSLSLGYNFLSLILMTLPYIFSGIAFGILYIKNDCNIMVPTIVHMLSNIISMIGIIALY